MSFPFRTFVVISAIVTGLITSYSVLAKDEIFDRLDGTGESHVRIDVIEWDGNLEIHAYPKGSLKGLSAKIDDRTEGKKVMVVGYRFANMKTPLVRRAILGIPFNKDVKGFIDSTNKEFDKLAISNQQLSKPFIAYKLDPSPKQWYPDGDLRNEDEAPMAQPRDGVIMTEVPTTTAPTKLKRAPASVDTEETKQNDGAIKSFSW